MDKPCCKGVVRDEKSLVGKTIKVGDLSVYESAPAKPGKMGVIVIYDIFGGTIPNCKYIADHLASHGMHAMMPDFYAAQGVKAWGDETTLGTPEFGAWFPTVMSPAFWAKFCEHITTVSKALKDKGCTKVGVIGFCWGGKASSVASALPCINAAVSCHGVAHSVDDVKNAKCPATFYSVENDPYFNQETQDAMRKLLAAKGGEGCDVTVVEGTYHGFVVRGDFAKDAELKKKADAVVAGAVKFFQTHLNEKKRKSPVIVTSAANF